MLDEDEKKVSLCEPETDLNIDSIETDSDEVVEIDNIDNVELKALREENEDLKDRLIRAIAESENQRKRGERDRRDAELYGGRKLAHDMLSVYDNLKRALSVITDEMRRENKSLFEGIDLTQREMMNVFAKHQIIPITPEVGDKFNPELHQAMFEAPMPDVEAGHIIQLMEEGFLIANRLMRPAKVGVSSGG